jgi:hypothetical protein
MNLFTSISDADVGKKTCGSITRELNFKIPTSPPPLNPTNRTTKPTYHPVGKWFHTFCPWGKKLYYMLYWNRFNTDRAVFDSLTTPRLFNKKTYPNAMFNDRINTFRLNMKKYIKHLREHLFFLSLGSVLLQLSHSSTQNSAFIFIGLSITTFVRLYFYNFYSAFWETFY